MPLVGYEFLDGCLDADETLELCEAHCELDGIPLNAGTIGPDDGE